jgi:REP element-mobilizing transposase RayT
MNNPIPIEHGKYYHIYNRGINGCELFRENTNYRHFLKLYEKYIPCIADTYAWCLLGNHFHLLVRIKDEEEIDYIPLKNKSLPGIKSAGRIERKLINNPSEATNLDGFKKKRYKPSNQFSHLFNSYSQAFNKKYNRTGSLFAKPFRRKQIINEKYLKYLVYYIHHNPVHHGFVDDMIKYRWSSYLTILSAKETYLKRKEVIEWFDDIENFEYFHKQQHKLDELKEILIDG